MACRSKSRVACSRSRRRRRSASLSGADAYVDEAEASAAIGVCSVLPLPLPLLSLLLDAGPEADAAAGLEASALPVADAAPAEAAFAGGAGDAASSIDDCAAPAAPCSFLRLQPAPNENLRHFYEELCARASEAGDTRVRAAHLQMRSSFHAVMPMPSTELNCKVHHEHDENDVNIIGAR